MLALEAPLSICCGSGGACACVSGGGGAREGVEYGAFALLVEKASSADCVFDAYSGNDALFRAIRVTSVKTSRTGKGKYTGGGSSSSVGNGDGNGRMVAGSFDALDSVVNLEVELVGALEDSSIEGSPPAVVTVAFCSEAAPSLVAVPEDVNALVGSSFCTSTAESCSYRFPDVEPKCNSTVYKEDTFVGRGSGDFLIAFAPLVGWI